MSDSQVKAALRNSFAEAVAMIADCRICLEPFSSSARVAAAVLGNGCMGAVALDLSCGAWVACHALWSSTRCEAGSWRASGGTLYRFSARNIFGCAEFTASLDAGTAWK